ncbi:MAG: hypothetical protein WD063_19345 [Pirellulales bacterium]
MAKLAQLAIGLALVGAWANPSALAADDKVDLTGAWEVTIDIGGQQGAPEFTLKQEGDKLTGKYKGQFGEADVTGKVKGQEVEFSFELQEGMKAVYKGTIEKDGTMKGKADYAGQATGEWTGKRKKADK